MNTPLLLIHSGLADSRCKEKAQRSEGGDEPRGQHPKSLGVEKDVEGLFRPS